MKSIRTRLLLSFVLITAIGAVPAAAQGDAHRKHPGFVDGSAFLALAGEETGSVEVSLDGALLKALMGFDPELKKLAGGLASIHAVVLDFSEEEAPRWTEAQELVAKTEKSLVGRGWSRITKIREEGAAVSVLVLNDEEIIGGLVVLVAGEDGEVVFANIAGDIDLAAIAKLGEKLDIPGLDQLDEGDD